MFFYCINLMIYERDKPDAILLESSQLSQYNQTTNKSSKLLITKLTLVDKWFKYPTLSQEEQSPWPKMQILTGLTYIININILKQLSSWCAHYCEPAWQTASLSYKQPHPELSRCKNSSSLQSKMSYTSCVCPGMDEKHDGALTCFVWG